jgi:HSP20 family protein
VRCVPNRLPDLAAMEAVLLDRSFSLAHDIDQAKAEAEYRDGVLQLTLPKTPGGAGKRVTIS